MSDQSSPRPPLQPHPGITRVMTPFRDFAHTEASGGILLFVAAVVALVWANSPWSEHYTDLWHSYVSVQFGRYGLEMSLSHWINDGLMAIFFFVVGLEIKREFLVGELSSLRQALLPIAAAVGGALLPATIFVAITFGSDNVRGWGIPMATDIAFALGVLALLGSRVPTGLKIFLTALAIADDIMAVLVIAVFYTDSVKWDYLLAGIGLIVVLFAANRLGIRHIAVYGGLGVVVWLAFIESGVHATVAGVLLALTIPSRTRIDVDEFIGRSRVALDKFDRAGAHGTEVISNPGHQSALQDIETATEQVQAPMQKLEHNVHPWVAFVIVPLFALANAGVSVGDNLDDAVTSPLSLGIVAGLVLGKQIGIMTVVWLLVRSNVSSLPDGVGWRHIYGAACLAGIGFTMSLFIADLAFEDDEQLALAKLGILGASVIAGVIGFTLLRLATKPQPEQPSAPLLS